MKRAILPWVPVIAFMMSIAQAQPVRIAGSGANVGAVELLVAEFRKQVPAANFARVDAIGSTGAVKAVVSGTLHIGLISRPLTEAEKSLQVTEVEYARTPFVLVVRADSKIVSLTDEQLAQFMSGAVESGPDQVRVRPVLRPADDVDTALLRRMAPRTGAVVDAALKRPGMMVATNDREAADMVERTVGSIGANALGLVIAEARQLRAVPLDGMQPSLSAFEAGKYPHYKRLALVTSARHALPAEAKRFIEFVSSPAGKAVLRRTGHSVPPF